MYKIAIVGNIAAGKSTVQDYLVKKGFCVIDTDDIARNVRKKYVKRIVDALKYYDITDNNGNISKDKL
ncbi:dephospho-CoA kinase, partial [bacterium]|nr:dephospho-CoA kinase [bacterium]